MDSDRMYTADNGLKSKLLSKNSKFHSIGHKLPKNYGFMHIYQPSFRKTKLTNGHKSSEYQHQSMVEDEFKQRVIKEKIIQKGNKFLKDAKRKAKLAQSLNHH